MALTPTTDSRTGSRSEGILDQPGDALAPPVYFSWNKGGWETVTSESEFDMMEL